MIRYYVLICLCMIHIVVAPGKNITFDIPVANVFETDTAARLLCTVKTTEKKCELMQSNVPFDLEKHDPVYEIWFKYDANYPKLDYSTKQSYTLKVKCNSVSGTMRVDVHPNAPPEIADWPSKTVSNIKAKQTVLDDLIYKVTATDPDGDSLTFKMYSDPDLEYFKINENTGEITAAIDMRSATVDVIPLKVNVSDGRNTVGPFTIYVRLKELNSRPVITNLPNNVTVKETALAGDTLLQLTFDDNDVYDLANFQPTCSVFPTNENYKFKYDTASRKIKLDSVPAGDTLLDYETTQFYNISCVISDGFLDSQGDYLNVFVQNVNEPPIFNNDLYTCNLYESKAGVSTCDLPWTITEPEGQTFNTILLPGNNSERFFIDSTNTNANKLTFNTNYDVDNNAMPDQVYVTVAAVDSLGETGTSKILVNIRDVNDNAPDFGIVGQSYTIGADTALGLLGNVAADDPDIGTNGEVTYTLTGGSASALAYVNVLGNGEVRYANQYDYSLAGQTHYLEVTAKDKGSPQKSSTATIAVAFETTTTTTTTPSPTVQQQTVIVNNVASTSTGFLDSSTNVALLATLLSLLALAGLAAILCCCCRGGGAGASRCFSGGESNSFCDCFSSQKKVREVRRPRRIIREPTPEPEIVEKPKRVVVEEYVEEPQFASSVVPYDQSAVSYETGYSNALGPRDGGYYY